MLQRCAREHRTSEAARLRSYRCYGVPKLGRLFFKGHRLPDDPGKFFAIRPAMAGACLGKVLSDARS
jgi:hypothetical protein